MDFVGSNWQEQPAPVDVRAPYSTFSWPSTSWGCNAETQTLSLHDLVSEALKAMITDRLRSKGLPLIACAHTRGFQLENIINGIVESHRVTCKQSKQVQHQGNTSLHEVDNDENEVQEASRLIEELSSALTQSIQQHSGSDKAKATGIRQQRKRHMGDTESGASPEHKKAKRAPKGTVYPCAKCNTTFSMQKDLIKHYNIVHSLTRPFKCDQCESWFKVNSDRTKHFKAVHLNEYNFYCSICNRGTHTKKKLIEHENTHLKDEDKPIKCKYCNKGFPSATKDLKIHVRTHEVETKVKCELCTARFVSFHDSYKSHMKLVHKAHVRYESNKCLLCDKEFGEYKQRPLLMEHMKENHSDMGFACKECGRKFTTAAKLATHEQSEHMIEQIEEDATTDEESTIEASKIATKSFAEEIDSPSKKGEVESKQLREKSLQPEICTTVNSNNFGHTAGRKYLSAPGHPKVERASRPIEGSNQVKSKHAVESHQTKVTEPRNRNTVEDGMKKRRCIVLRSEGKNDDDKMVRRSTTTAKKSQENQHDSNKISGQLENAGKVCSKPQLQICLPPGAISGGKVRNFAPNPDQVKEMIRTGKITISMKVPVTTLGTPASGQTPSSASLQQNTGKTLVLVDSAFTPDSSGPRVDARATSGSNSDRKQLSSSKGDTHKAFPIGDKNDTSPPSSVHALKDDKAIKSDTKATFSSMLDIMGKTSNVQHKVGTTKAGSVAELIQTGKINLSVNNSGTYFPKPMPASTNSNVVLVDNVSNPSTSLLRLQNDTTGSSSSSTQNLSHTTASTASIMSTPKVQSPTLKQENVSEPHKISPRRPIILLRQTGSPVKPALKPGTNVGKQSTSQ